MGLIRRLTCFGFVLCCLLLSASAASAQAHDSTADLRRRTYPSSPSKPPTTLVYRFCESWRESIQRSTIYYSGIFAEDQRDDLTPAEQGFLQFIEHKSYKGTGQNVSTDVSCSGEPMPRPAPTSRLTWTASGAQA